MPAMVEILTIPIGSQLTSTISGTDKADKNDFPVLLLFSENVNLTESGLTVSAGATLVSLEGKNSVWKAIIRPPQTAGTVTVTVAANAVSQGNPQTTKSIRISTSFPDADAESSVELFMHSLANTRGIALTPTRIVLSSGRGLYSEVTLTKFSHSGTEQTSEQSAISGSGAPNGSRKIDFINGEYLVSGGQGGRYRENGSALEKVLQRNIHTGQSGISHSRLGYTAIGSGTAGRIYTQVYGGENKNFITHTINRTFGFGALACQNDLIYLLAPSGNQVGYAEITDGDEIEYRKDLNINQNANSTDISIFRDTLYFMVSLSSRGSVETLDIKKYRPLAKNTKSTIYPIFANEGDTIDLNQFSPDAERIVFDVGYDLQPNLSINASNGLVVGSGAQTCLVKLKAINRIGATETDSFQFYLIVRRAAAPVWRGVSELTMKAGSSYDLFQLVPDAESISFRSGRARLTDSSLSNGKFRIGTMGGVAEFTARKGSRSSHIAITIDVVQGNDGSDSPDVSGYRIEIAGIDVTPDSVELPSVSETLDPVVLNEYRVNEASITLRNGDGKYNSDNAGNFWETHGLNAGGFQNAVKIYLKHTDGTESLHFSGIVNESFVPIKDAQHSR